MTAKLDKHEFRIKTLEENVEKISESVIATEKKITEQTQIQKHTTHELKMLRTHVEKQGEKVNEIENELISEASFKKGLLAEKDRSHNRINLVRGIAGVLAALVVAFLTVHEFVRNIEPKHHIQQTLSRGK